MSRNTKSWVVLPLATIFAMVLTLLGGIAPASATVTYPQQPVVVDRSGADQDGFIIPDLSGVDYFADSWKELLPGEHSSGGNSSYGIRTTYIDDEGYVMDGPRYTLTFNHEVSGTEAPNGFKAVLGACNTKTGRTALTVYLQNPADASGRYLPEGELHSNNIDGAGGFILTPRVYDGSTVAVEFVLGGGGVFPGTNTVEYWAGGSIVEVEKIWVPACGKYDPPSDDPGPDGIGQSGTRMPAGRVYVTNCRRSIVKAVMNNKRTSVRAKYWLTINWPGPGRKSTKRFVVKSGVKKVVKRDVVAGTRVTLKVTKPGTNKRKRLGRVVTPLVCSS